MTEREMLETILQKVTGIEANVAGLQTDVAGVKTDVTGLRADITGLKTDVTDLKADVAGLKIDATDLKADVTGLKTDVAGMKAKLDMVYEQTVKLTEDMSELKAYARERIEPKLDEHDREIAFLRHKETANERDIFFLKQARQA